VSQVLNDPPNHTEQEARYTGPVLHRGHGERVDCEQAELLISRHLDGELSPGEAVQLNEHLKSCGNCRSHLANWTMQSSLINSELSELWPAGNATHFPKAGKMPAPQAHRSKLRPCMWVPLGMVASQVLALSGLSIYFFFFTSPVQAPHSSAQTDKTGTSQVPKVATASTLVERPVSETHSVAAEDVPATSPTSQIEKQPEVPAAPAATAIPTAVTHDLKESRTEIISFAAPMANELPRKLKDICVEYKISASADGSVKDEAGTIRILGDVLSDRCIVRLSTSHDATRNICVRDIGTLLNPAQRSVVKHLLALCAQPEMRKRIAAAKP